MDCRGARVELDKVVLGVFFSSRRDLMDCVGGLCGIGWRWVFFFFIRVGFDGLCRWVEWDKEA